MTEPDLLQLGEFAGCSEAHFGSLDNSFRRATASERTIVT
jgi:hypothetical protein